MQHFASMNVGEISLIADENHKKLLVIVESTDEPHVYDTEEEPGPANIFDNLYTKWNDILDVGGVNLAVFSYENRFVRDNSPQVVLQRIEKDVAKLAAKMELKSKSVGIILCSSEISRSAFHNAYDYVNVLVRNSTPQLGVDTVSSKKTKSLTAFPIRLPFDSKFSWTNSVPAWLWTKTGSVKDDGAGVNLLGFIVRAASVVLFKQTEGSILDKMQKYHSGQFGSLKIVQNIKQLKQMFNDLYTKKYISIDTETDNLNRIADNTLLAVQFCCADSRDDIPKMWVLPVEHSETPWTSKILKWIKMKLRNWFERKSKGQTHVYQNSKFDMHQFMAFTKLRWYAAKIYDVMAGTFSLEENQKFMKPMQIKPFSLEHMERCMEYDRPADLVIQKADRGKMATFSMKDIANYGVIDVLTPLYIMFEQIEIAKNREYPRFFTFITRQMGPMLYVMTEMEHNGIQVDFQYLKEIASPIGPLAEMIRNAAGELQKGEAAQKANKELLSRSSFQKKGLFGKAVEPQLWSIRDNKHLQLLFFEILGLEPLHFRKDETGKLNKLFQKVYRHTKEVKQFSKYQKLIKLKSAFADAIYKYMSTHPDMRRDHRLRPLFGFLGVLTGRSSTTSPSTQQIPTHGDDAKIIKKQFKVKKGRILLKSDYSAHEVRVSGNITRDPAICGAVDAVNAAFTKFRMATTAEEALAAMNELVDIHCANYEVFFGVKISKSDPRRQDAKAAVFAVTYGSMAKSIGEKMHSEALYALEDQLVKDRALPANDNNKMSPRAVRDLEKRIRYMKSEKAAEEYFQRARDLLEVLYDKWSTLTKFINREQKKAQAHNVVFGPHGRPRHLWGYLHFDKFVGFAMNRRVFNSEGQGYASDYGYTGIYLAKKAKWDLFESRGYTMDTMQTNAVHDSSFNDVAFRFLPLAVYMQEHAMISLTQQYYKQHFGITPTAQYGFDIEIGISEAGVTSWNGRSDSFDLPGGKKSWGMIDLLTKFGTETGASETEIANAIADWNRLQRLRLEELHSKNPDHMSLYQPEIWNRIVPHLHCFKKKAKKSAPIRRLKAKPKKITASNVIPFKSKKVVLKQSVINFKVAA